MLSWTGTLWVNYGDAYASTSTQEQAGNFEHKRKYQCKPKDLMGLPWMLAFALRSDGWYLRSDIIWSKPNPMPESVRDRPTRAHEYLFLLSKSRKYYYDADAVSTEIVDSKASTPESAARAFNAKRSEASEKRQKPISVPSGWATEGEHSAVAHNRPDKQRGHSRRHAGFNDRWDDMTMAEQQANGANLRDVWTIATHPYKEAHFATFPPALVEKPILAGTRPGDLVLDPFSGASTTGLMALRLGRRYLGIELNPEYAEMGRKRIIADAPLFNKSNGSKP